MSDSKVFMFPENGYNNNGGFGLGGWGGGLLGFILGILFGNGGLFGGNGWGGWGNNGIANQLNKVSLLCANLRARYTISTTLIKRVKKKEKKSTKVRRKTTT